ncbi:MAG: hypothetical protein IPG44_17290 [Anaerolineales bacterium]|nr:hypothetical protein [Anaerolineales bacterium]
MTKDFFKYIKIITIFICVISPLACNAFPQKLVGETPPSTALQEKWDIPLEHPGFKTSPDATPENIAIEFLLDNSKSVVGEEGNQKCPHELTKDVPFHKRDVSNILITLRKIFQNEPATNLFYVSASSFGESNKEILSPTLVSQLSNNQNGLGGWLEILKEPNIDSTSYYGMGFQNAYDSHMRGLAVDRKILYVLTDGFGFEDYPQNDTQLRNFLNDETIAGLEIKLVLLCPDNSNVESFWASKGIITIHYNEWLKFLFEDIDGQFLSDHGWVSPYTNPQPLDIPGDSSNVNFYFQSFTPSSSEGVIIENRDNPNQPDRRYVSDESQTFPLVPLPDCGKHSFQIGEASTLDGFWWANFQTPMYTLSIESPDEIINNAVIEIKADIQGIGSNNQQWRKCYIPYLEIDEISGAFLQAFWDKDVIYIANNGSSSYAKWKWSPKYLSPNQTTMRVYLFRDESIIASDSKEMDVKFMAQPNFGLNKKTKIEKGSNGYPQDVYVLEYYFDYVVSQPRVELVTTKNLGGQNCPNLTINDDIGGGKYAKKLDYSDGADNDFWGKGYSLVGTAISETTYRYILKLPWDTLNLENCAYGEVRFVWFQEAGIVPKTWAADLSNMVGNAPLNLIELSE